MIAITLEEKKQTTRNFLQTFFVTEEDRDGPMWGWYSSFDKLEELLREVTHDH